MQRVKKNRMFKSAAILITSLVVLSGCGSDTSSSSSTTEKGKESGKAVELLNVSYDPTRELYQEFNGEFAKYWKKKTGQR